MSKDIHFPKYIAPAERNTAVYNRTHTKRALREYGVSVQRARFEDRHYEQTLEWFTGYDVPPLAQHLGATTVLLNLISAARCPGEPFGNRLPGDYMAQFMTPLDSPDTEGNAYTDIFTIYSPTPPKMEVAKQPAIYNYDERRFRHTHGTEPKPIDLCREKRYTEITDCLHLIQESLKQRLGTETLAPLERVDSSNEPSNEELHEIERNNMSLIARIKHAIWR